MNPTSEYNANPFKNKDLLLHVGLYRLNETAPPSDITTPPDIELLADMGSQYDYKYASYMAALNRAVREYQHLPKNQEADELGHTHRIRLTHEEFEVHVQTIMLPVIEDDGGKGVEVKRGSESNGEDLNHVSDNDNSDDDSNDNDETEDGVRLRKTQKGGDKNDQNNEAKKKKKKK